MITFDPPELRERIAKAIRTFKKAMGGDLVEYSDDLIDPGADGFDPNEYSDLVIQGSSKLALYLPRSDGTFKLTYEDLLAFVDELVGAKLEEGLRCWTSKRLLVRVIPVFDEATQGMARMLEGAPFPSGFLEAQSVSKNGTNVACSIVSGVTHFAFLVERDMQWDKTYPPVLWDELFVHARWDGSVAKEEILEIVGAYLFEVECSTGFVLVPTSRSDGFRDDESSETKAHPQLRPLLLGRGLGEVIATYNAAVWSWDCEYQILGFAKVLEYVSSTILRAQLVESVRLKLASQRALDPDATFVLELEALMAEHKQHRRDKEAMKATVATCCDALELSRLAPNFLRRLGQLTVTSDEKERRAALDEFSAALTATRNWLAHAKANYAPTGEECPQPQLQALARCARLAAQQAIRWYSMRPEAARVT